MRVPVLAAKKLRAEGMGWRDIAQEIAWATGRKFSLEGLQRAVRARKVLSLPTLSVDQSETVDALVGALWRLKVDTATMARALGRPQSDIANRLAAIRDEVHAQ